jgi:hypothetical protein
MQSKFPLMALFFIFSIPAMHIPADSTEEMIPALVPENEAHELESIQFLIF